MSYGKEEISGIFFLEFVLWKKFLWFFIEESIPEILREYPELRKLVENLASEEFLKGFKLREVRKMNN